MNPVARSVDQALTFPAKLILGSTFSHVILQRKDHIIHTWKLPNTNMFCSPKLISKFFFFSELGTRVPTEKVLRKYVSSPHLLTKVHLDHYFNWNTIPWKWENQSNKVPLQAGTHQYTRNISWDFLCGCPRQWRGEFYPPIAAIWW